MIAAMLHQLKASVTLGVVTLGMLLFGSRAEASPRLGAAAFTSDSTACVTFRSEPRRVGDQVLLFLFSPPRIVDGWIREASKGPCNQSAGPEDRGYLVALRYRIPVSDEIGVGLFDPTAHAEYSNGEFIVRTEGARAPLQFRQCTSQEGLHLTAWRGNRRTWHEYWYLGYDLEPNCSDEEAKE
jgi:hypothetical protein